MTILGHIKAFSSVDSVSARARVFFYASFSKSIDVILSNEVPGTLFWCLEMILRRFEILWFLEFFDFFGLKSGLAQMAENGHFLPIFADLARKFKKRSFDQNIWMFLRSPKK